LRLVERTERARWNARPAVASVQASAAGMHWVRALSPGSTEVEFMLGGDEDHDADRHADRSVVGASEGAGPERCLSVRIEVALDLSVPRSLIRTWAESLARDPLLPPPEVGLEAREHLLVLHGEVARADQAQALEALLRAWIETQSGTRAQLLNWVKVRSPEQVMLEVRIAEVT